jgi:hypothetical protein
MICRFCYSNQLHFYKIFRKIPLLKVILLQKFLFWYPLVKNGGGKGQLHIPVFSVPCYSIDIHHDTKFVVGHLHHRPAQFKTWTDFALKTLKG